MEKKPFVTKEQLDEIVKKYPTPFHLYDEMVLDIFLRSHLTVLLLQMVLLPWCLVPFFYTFCIFISFLIVVFHWPVHL